MNKETEPLNVVRKQHSTPENVTELNDGDVTIGTRSTRSRPKDNRYLQEITRETSRASLNGFGSAQSYEVREDTRELLGLVDSDRHGRALPSDNLFRDEESRSFVIKTNKDLCTNKHQSVTKFQSLTRKGMTQEELENSNLSRRKE